MNEQDAVLRGCGHAGVTVLIHDGTCANERRRRQKRRQLPASNRFVVINEESARAAALRGADQLHVAPPGRRSSGRSPIHASSCNQDLCLGGDCPSFVTVETAPGTGYQPAVPVLPADAVPEPPSASDSSGPRVPPGVGEPA